MICIIINQYKSEHQGCEIYIQFKEYIILEYINRITV